MTRKVISTEEDATSHEVVFPARHGQNSGQISTIINTPSKGRTTVLIPENSRKFSPGVTQIQLHNGGISATFLGVVCINKTYITGFTNI